MTTKKMTIKEIVDTIPARLGLDANQIDLSTPEKAEDFLRDPDFQIFAQTTTGQKKQNRGQSVSCQIGNLMNNVERMH